MRLHLWNMETLEQLQARHQKEQRDLQARVTQKKKAATKKTRKGVNTECEELERTLKDRQGQELSIINGGSVPSSDDVPELDQDPIDEDLLPSSSTFSTKDTMNGLADALQGASITPIQKPEDGEGRKRNRQRERLARRAAEQEAAAIEAEAEAAKLPNWKRQERSSMVKAFKENGLVEKEIAPDGHCLFSAVADQLSEAGIPLAEGGEAVQGQDGKYRMVRKTAATYIEGHPDEFIGFLDEPLGTYVQKIRDSAEWGGQLELIALAKSYNIEICVLQDGRIDRFEPGTGDGQQPERIWLAYYRHGYGLGEHYNSLRKAP
jgi:OTU domain-containing protein 6